MRLKRFLLFAFLFIVGSFADARSQGGAFVEWQVTRFDLTVTLPKDERALTARAVISARNIGNGAGNTFTVRLNQATEVRAASVNDAAARFDLDSDAKLKLKLARITLPTVIQPSGRITVTIDYRLPVGENTGLLALSPESAQALPLAYWYPVPNTIFAPHGADYAPLKLTVNAPNGETILSTGKANGATFEQSLNVQPFFLTGKWETIEGANEAKGISAWMNAGAGADEKQRATEFVNIAGAARKFFSETLGEIPDVNNSPIRLVAVQRGAGFDMAGSILLDEAAFKRTKPDAINVLRIAEGVARLWIGGASSVRGEGAGVVREGLVRHLATLFLEKQFGRDAAEAELLRERIAYAAIAKRDASLAQTSPSIETYYTSVTNKGALVWRLIEHTLGSNGSARRAAFNEVLRGAIMRGRENGITLALLRSAFNERGGDALKKLIEYEIDQPTDMDLLVGLPQQRGGEWVAALRNTGNIEVNVSVSAIAENGERQTFTATIPARDFGEARFKMAAKPARVEVDAEKFYPQIDYTNDVAPRTPALQEGLATATQAFAQSKFADAETIAREILQREPLYQEARITLARSLLGQKKIDEAEREFRNALNDKLPLPTTLSWANVGLGEIARGRGNNSEAAKRFNDAVRADGEYAATLFARNARIAAESAAGIAPPIDAAVTDFIARFDAAIKSGRKTEIDALLLPGELTAFSKGIVGSQPEIWKTTILRTEQLDANRLAVDVSINTRTLGKDQKGTAVFILARGGGSLRLAAIQLFEVK